MTDTRKLIAKFVCLALAIILAVLCACTVVVCKVNPSVTVCEDYTLFTDVCYGNARRNYLDLCLPQDVSGTLGLIVLIHGGGWIWGDKDLLTESVTGLCTSHGYAVAAINYRYANGEGVTADDILDDITASLAKIKTLASEHGITIEKALLNGGSAGAHLSLLYCYSRFDSAPITPAVAVSMSGPTDLADPNFFNCDKSILGMVSKVSGTDVEKNSRESTLPALAAASPITYATSASVPTIICHGVHDSVVPYSNAVTLDARLTELGVTHEFITFPNSEHGLESDPDCAAQASDLMFEYAARYLN